MISGTQGQDQVVEAEKRPLPKKLFITIAMVAIALYMIQPVFSQWSSSTPSINESELLFADVIRGELVRDVAVNGKVVAANAPQLYSSEEGQITLLAKPGETVTKGQVVATLSSPELKAQIMQQQSALEQLKIDAKRGELADKEGQLNLERELNASISELNVAKRERQRAELSYSKQVMSEVDWLKSQDRLEDANRNYLHAKKRVEFAKERLVFESQNREFEVARQQLVLDELIRRQNALDIKATVNGVVGNWLVAQKNKVGANTAVMSIVDLSEYEAELTVPEFYADDLGIGLDVSIKIGNSTLQGQIMAVSPEIKDNQVQVRAKILDGSNVQLRQNQRLNARIEFERKPNTLMVKKGAFVGSFGGKYAFKVTDQEHASKVAITIGTNSVEYVEILGGLKAGDRLIISDYEKYQQAEQIRFQ